MAVNNNLLFLINDAGINADTFTLSTGTTASNYNLYDLIAGYRSSLHRTESSGSEILRQYAYSADLDIDYVVLARADYLITENGTRVRLKEKASGGSWSYISGIDYNTLDSTDLIGLNSQDLVIPVTLTEYRGLALSTITASGSEASVLSKFFGCVSKSINGIINKGLEYQEQLAGTKIKSLENQREFEIESIFTLTISDLLKSDIVDLSLYLKYLYMPFFIYDPNQDIWDHKLEHVILINYEEILLEKNNYNLSLTIGRLKQDV